MGWESWVSRVAPPGPWFGGTERPTYSSLIDLAAEIERVGHTIRDVTWTDTYEFPIARPHALFSVPAAGGDLREVLSWTEDAGDGLLTTPAPLEPGEVWLNRLDVILNFDEVIRERLGG